MIMYSRITLLIIVLLSIEYSFGQKVGIGITNPQYELDVNGKSASDNQVSIIPLWQSGSNYVMSNTSGMDLVNVGSGIDPTIYSSTGDLDVKLVIRISSSTAGTNNFQLRAHNGTTEFFPILNTDSWTFANTQSGKVAVSPWKNWAAGINACEIHLFGWLDAGNTNISSVYLMIRPKR